MASNWTTELSVDGETGGKRRLMREKKEGKVWVGGGKEERGGRRAWEPRSRCLKTQKADDERRPNIPQAGFPALLPCGSLRGESP